MADERPDPTPPLTHHAAVRVLACGAGVGTRANHGGYTIGEIWTAESDYDAVRLVFMNDAPFETSVGPVAVAASVSAGANPLQAGGGAAALRPATFGGQPTLRMPACAEAPEGHFAWVPDLYRSDWVELASLPREDDGPGRLVHVRSVLAPGTEMRGPGIGDENSTVADPSRSTGRIYRTFFEAGDRLHQPMQVQPGQQGAGAVYAVEFRLRTAGLTVQMVGDSIGAGTGSGNGALSFGLKACVSVSTAARPVSFLQCAVPAENAAHYVRAAAKDLESVPIGVALIQTWSGNDVKAEMSPEQAQAAADLCWHHAVDYADRVRASGGVPIFLTAVPQKTRCPTAALDAARLSSVSRCHRLAARGERVVDLNGILGDGGSPVDYRPEFLTDHFHPNDAGQDAVAAVLVPMLRHMVG